MNDFCPTLQKVSPEDEFKKLLETCRDWPRLDERAYSAIFRDIKPMSLEYNDPYPPLPSGLPLPVDDGACDHLPRIGLPPIALLSTKKKSVDLSQITDRAVVFFFPAAGRPGLPDPEGWNLIPGARGCTPQLCDYRYTTLEFQKLGVKLFGVSSQRHEDQVEIATRNRLQYELLSDEELRLTKALRLPTFRVQSPVGLVPPVCIKRLTLIIDSGRVEKVFYPVFPPDKSAKEVLAYLKQSGTRR